MDFANVPVMWEPKEGSGKRIKELKKCVERKYNVQLGDYWDLHKWSVENVPQFWEELWDYMRVIYSQPYEKVIDLSVPMEKSPEWFPGARLNYAENLLRYRDDHVALIVAGEDREAERVTYAQMYEEAKLYAAALRKMGVKKGDRVSCLMSNRKEALFAVLGTTSIGAIWVSSLPMMGSQAIINRFKQVQPKVLFTIDRFPHNMQEIEMLSKLEEIAKGLPSLEKVIIVPSKPESELKNINGIKNSCFLDDFLETGKNRDGSVPEMEFEQVSFSHPVFISYTSGTTGPPKALVHGCGIILSNSRDCFLHIDFDRSNTVWLSMSPVGWITWNSSTAMHFFGATIVLYEGIPCFLSPTYLWDLVDKFKISNLLLTPNILDELEKRGCLPTKKNHLKSLKLLMSGGGIVKPQNYDFVYKKVKSDMLTSSVYGLTELMVTCTALEYTLKVHRGEITAPSLAVDMETLDDTGKPIMGEMGELVINKPLPSMPLGFWGDKNGSIFKKAYFEKFPGKFRLGDLAIINPATRGIKICGRCDGTLLARGCRFNSSEIYDIVNAFSEVHDSLCVSQYNKYRQERAVLFLKMRNGCLFSEDLAERIRGTIHRELSARHVPDMVLETADIPYNMNGKKMEVTVKNIINGMPYNAETIINPGSLRNFQNVPQLQGY